MSRSKIVVLMMVVLALVAIGHHQLVSRNMNLVPAAEAASLQASSGAGDSCTGTGTWHFVNPQSGGICL